MIVYTSICANYLPKAMALAESVKRHIPDALFVLCLVEREVPEEASLFPHFDRVILAKDAGWQDFDAFMFRHTIVEASTAVKPRFMIHLTETYPGQDKFVYLDPDVLVYSDFEELRHLLDTHSIVLAPHLLRPGNVDMEISSLAHGTFNLGFLAVRRSDNAARFLDWWAERLFLFCYDDKGRGIFTDQRWIDLAPSFFDTHILKHHGYDFATWSLLGSDLSDRTGMLVANGDPLRFIHFSGLDSGTIDKAIGWWLTDANRVTFARLFEDYKALLAAHGQETLGRLPWSYGNYVDGRPVGKAARIAYRDRTLWPLMPKPFETSDDAILAAAGLSPSSAAATAAAQSDDVPGILERVLRSARRDGWASTAAKAISHLKARLAS